MKKFFVSFGLAAAGTASLHAAILDPASKDYKVSATLRGFYDDNYLTSPKKEGSLGFELSPGFELNLPLPQTEIGLQYIYGLYYYQKRQDAGQNPFDQTHQFDLWIDHAFNPRWDLRLADTVRIAQDPALTSSGTAVTKRVSGNNLANTANLSLHTDWTPLVSSSLNYQNVFYRYENRGPAVLPGPPTNVVASLAGMMDRVEQTINPEVEWKVSPTTSFHTGYKFGLVNFTAGEVTVFNTNNSSFYTSSSRDNYSHYGYVGAGHAFLPNLSGNVDAGVQYTKYYNDPAATAAFGPYAQASMIYTYGPASYAQFGFTLSRNATDTIKLDTNGRITQDQQSAVAYGSINQPLTTELVGSVIVRYQHSIFHQGAYDSLSSDFYDLGLNLTYSFSRHLSSEIGYNFDYYKSAAGGNYTRNRLYLGITASY